MHHAGLMMMPEILGRPGQTQVVGTSDQEVIMTSCRVRWQEYGGEKVMKQAETGNSASQFFNARATG